MSTGTPRWIMHLDMDAFYAAVEQRDAPALRGRPVVVGAQPGGRGVMATCSYEARRFGIRSAMPIAEAHRRCPDAVYMRPRMAHYHEVARRTRAVMDACAPVVEPISIDEAFLDVSGPCGSACGNHRRPKCQPRAEGASGGNAAPAGCHPQQGPGHRSRSDLGAGRGQRPHPSARKAPVCRTAAHLHLGDLGSWGRAAGSGPARAAVLVDQRGSGGRRRGDIVEAHVGPKSPAFPFRQAYSRGRDACGTREWL